MNADDLAICPAPDGYRWSIARINGVPQQIELYTNEGQPVAIAAFSGGRYKMSDMNFDLGSVNTARGASHVIATKFGGEGWGYDPEKWKTIPQGFPDIVADFPVDIIGPEGKVATYYPGYDTDKYKSVPIQRPEVDAGRYKPGDVVLINHDKSMPRIVESVEYSGIRSTHHHAYHPNHEVSLYARP